MSADSPFATVLTVAGGYVLPRCLHVVADLGVADQVSDTPRPVAEVASAVGAERDALARVLSLLSAHGLFTCSAEGVSHTPASALLRTDHPQSMRSFARMFGSQISWSAYGSLAHTVRTGRPAADEVFPGGFWAYLAEHPDEAAIFNEAMMGKAHGAVAGIMGSYDFSAFRAICDVGGGSGHLLRAVLESAPNARGILFDLPRVIESAEGIASQRLALQAGDFFRDALPECDAYLLMEVIHDWNDDESLAILKAVRRAAPSQATLLLIEQMVPEEPGPSWVKTLDIHMLTLLGGRQRTLHEYTVLLEGAGFAFRRAIEAGPDAVILEAVAS